MPTMGQALQPSHTTSECMSCPAGFFLMMGLLLAAFITTMMLDVHLAWHVGSLAA